MARNFSRPSDQYFRRNAPIPVTGYPFTISAWVNVAEITSSAHTVLSIVNSGTTYGYCSMDINWGGGNPALRVTARTSLFDFTEAVQSISPSPVIGQKYHVCGLWFATNSRSALVNGVNFTWDYGSVGTTTFNRLQIGELTTNTKYNQQWTGHISDVAVYNTNLMQREIISLASGVSPFRVCPSSLVQYYPLLDATSSRDYTGNGYDLTEINGPIAYANHAPVAPPWGIARPKRKFISVPALNVAPRYKNLQNLGVYH